MRRAFTIAVLLLVSCAYRPVWVDDRPVVQTGVGSVPPKASQHMRGGAGARACREVSRTKCDTVNCKGQGLDLVTLQCSGGKVSRCELGTGGC